MRKITFLVLLFAYSLNAQTYCTISEDYVGIEAIASIAFGTTTINNSNSTSIYVDEIATSVNVAAGETYTITVKGSTNGDYNNEYVAYIDWNHNGILDDTGEVFYIGLINDSTGLDSKSATTSIVVPATALTGNTRIRITKVYTDSDPEFGYLVNYNPCAVSVYDIYFEETTASYGQALDFTLNVSTLNRDVYDKNAFVIYPNPASDVLNIDTNEKAENLSIFNLQGQLVLESINSKSINIESLASGHYILKISSGNLAQVMKFLKK